MSTSSLVDVRSGLKRCDCSEKGPLPDAVVQACEDTWKKVKGVATKYSN